MPTGAEAHVRIAALRIVPPLCHSTRDAYGKQKTFDSCEGLHRAIAELKLACDRTDDSNSRIASEDPALASPPKLAEVFSKMNSWHAGFVLD
jgi:hypothetical protein